MPAKTKETPEWIGRKLDGRVRKAEAEEPSGKDKQITLKLALTCHVKAMATTLPEYVHQAYKYTKLQTVMCNPRKIVATSPGLTVGLLVESSAGVWQVKCDRCTLKPGVEFLFYDDNRRSFDAVITLVMPYKDAWIKLLSDHLKSTPVYVKLVTVKTQQRSIPGTGHKPPAAKKRRVRRKTALKR